MSQREWKVWDLFRQNRLETYALIITFIFALYKIDTGYFSAGISVEPGCKMVETNNSKIIVGTLNLTGDKNRKVIIRKLEAIILAGDLKVENILKPNSGKSDYFQQEGEPQSCVFNGLNYELEYVKELEYLKESGNGKEIGKLEDKFLFQDDKNKVTSISGGDKVVFECIGNVSNYSSEDGLYTVDFRIAVERAGLHLKFVNWVLKNKYKERRATCVVYPDTTGR